MKYLNKENLIRLKQNINNNIDTKLLEYSKTNEVQEMIDTSINANITEMLRGDY